MSAPIDDAKAALAAAAAWLARGQPVSGARLRRALWPLAQTAVAAGLSYYIAHSLVGHVSPFFAPIAATVSMGTSTDQRVHRSLQLAAGVLLGIGIGVAVAAVLGYGPAALGVAVFIALCVALLVGRGFIAQGMLFFNQTAIGAILIIAVHSSAEGPDRLIDALIGGGVGLVFSLLLCPPDPAPVMRRASRLVFAACGQELRRLEEILAAPEPSAQGWVLPASKRISQALTGLDQARATAREIVRLAPLRWPGRAAVAAAEPSAADFAALASTVMAIGSLTVAAIKDEQPLPAELSTAIASIRAALAEAAEGRVPDPAEATGAAARAAASQERDTPAAVSQAAVIASVAVRSADLVHRAAAASQRWNAADPAV